LTKGRCQRGRRDQPGKPTKKLGILQMNQVLSKL
jgi:hypothetical protein